MVPPPTVNPVVVAVVDAPGADADVDADDEDEDEAECISDVKAVDDLNDVWYEEISFVDASLDAF